MVIFLFLFVILCIFTFFCNIRKKISGNTYGSTVLRVEVLNNQNGAYIKKDTLFNNLCNYWTRFNDRHKQFFWWYPHLLWKLEMSICRKWNKDLLKVNIVLKKFQEKDEFFDPRRFLEEFDAEKYFELLVGWKLSNEKKYLEEHPYLIFIPHRHQKILGKAIPTIRG